MASATMDGELTPGPRPELGILPDTAPPDRAAYRPPLALLTSPAAQGNIVSSSGGKMLPVPRTPTFSVEKALSMTMYQFWTAGFYGISIQDLVDHMGIRRSSLYNTFKSKQALYLRILRLYTDSHLQRFRALLEWPSPRSAILNVFGGNMVYEHSRDGCFLVNASVDRAPHDPAIADIVSHAFRELVQIFQQLIERAQAASEIHPSVVTGEAAQGLLHSYIALCVLIRSGADGPALREVGRQALLNNTQSS